MHQVLCTYDEPANKWAVTNVCQFAAVYGLDGNPWATTKEGGFQLATYEYDQPQEDGSTKKVLCNELSAIQKACDGNRKGGQECGIRMCNEKYMFLRNDVTSEKVKFCVLSRGPPSKNPGGACVAKTEKALIIGVWGNGSTGQFVEMSNKKTQNTGDCEKNVCNVADKMKKQGY